jgi:retinol dehydrogenase 12
MAHFLPGGFDVAIPGTNHIKGRFIYMNLFGKTCLITGATSGLGLATAKQFAQSGANVVLVCRNSQKGENAITEVKKEVPDAKLELMICDLTSANSIQNFLQKFKATHSTLNVLFNNAAVMKSHRTVTEDGFEAMFQTNYLAPVLLTTSLLDLLKNTSPSRIINIAVPPEKLRVNFDDLQSYKHYKYFNSFMLTKLYLLLYSIELSKRLANTDIIVNSIIPGLFKSELGRESPWILGKLMGLFSISADKAAEKIVFLAASREVLENSGKIFIREKEKSLLPYWNEPEVRERLWSITESLIEAFRK